MLKWSKWGGFVGIVVLAFLANMIILSSISRWLTLGAGLVLIYLLPGFLLVQVLCKRNTFHWVEQGVLSFGLGLGVGMLGGLMLYYLPGPMTTFVVLAFEDVLILALALLFVCRGRAENVPDVSVPLWPLLILVLVTVFFRLANLGYSEFQGDESRAMLMAAGVVRGEDAILFQHKKGPGEILLPAMFYALDGTIEEFTARLPFALSNLTGVVCVYVLTRRLFPRMVLAAPVAAGLLAVNGYLVAFGRIVQYQSVVFLMMALAMWCAYVWYCGGSTTLLILSMSCVALGALAHYEAVLVLPVVAWLFWRRGRGEKWSARQWMWQAGRTGCVFLILVGLFYVPFVSSPRFATTVDYIVGKRVGEGMFHNNLGDFFFRGTFYNSVYYILFLILGLLLFGADRLWVWLRPAPLALAVLCVLIAGMTIAVFFPHMLVVAGLNLAFVPFVFFLALLVASPCNTPEDKVLVIWFGAPCLIALFLMQLPKTHVYTMFPAWAILTGIVFCRIALGINRRIEQTLSWAGVCRLGVILAGVVLWAVFGYYEYIVFVRHDPDFRRGYPATLAFYPTFYPDDHPPRDGGGFGFPHRGGWKAVGALYAQGVLQGSYGANEETLTSSWYVRQAPWCRDTADQYFISSVIHDVEHIPEGYVRRELHLLGRVWSDGRSVLEIYGRQPVDDVHDYDLADLERVFDAAATPDVWLWTLPDPVPQHRLDARLGGRVRLLGFDVSPQVEAGEVLSLNLYWLPEADLGYDYSVFVHVEIEGDHIWGQSDTGPVCGSLPTSKWQPGEVIVDGRTLLIDPATPPGEYPLLAGLYDSMTGVRLNVSGRDANARGDTVYLGTVRVVAPTASSETGWDAP
jgi:4-amino-4-deoxy-L-arabinose transferase-like glycosyltransferase